MAQIRENTLRLLHSLVGFDSTSRNSNLPIVEFIQNYLAIHGVTSHLSYDAERTKASILATMGPANVPGIVLSGHTDVVSVDGQVWASDPWALTERDGKLYGRGTCDMKGFLAVVLAFVPQFRAANMSIPVHIAFSYDEELGCLGAPSLIADLLSRFPVPAMCIVGEPTSMEVATSHKGVVDTTVRIHGKAAHSSEPGNGVNAIEAAAKAIEFIGRVAKRKERLSESAWQSAPVYATINVGTIRGGTEVNVVPSFCEFSFDVRTFSERDTDQILAHIRSQLWDETLLQMTSADSSCGVSWTEDVRVPSFSVSEDSDVVGFVKSLAETNSTKTISINTEAGLYSEAAIPTVICGPGSVEQAHQADEFVSFAQLSRCEAFMERLVGALRLSERANNPQ